MKTASPFFVQLTAFGSSKSVFINISLVQSIYFHDFKKTIVYFDSDNAGVEVEETPDEIFAMCPGVR